MRRWLALLFGLMLGFARPVAGQGLIWEHRMGWRGSDELTDVIASDDSTFIACGLRDAYGHLHGSNNYFHPNVCLVKFNVHGDTLWIKSVGYDGEWPRLCKGDGNKFYLAFTAADDTLGEDMLTVMRMDFEGNAREHWTVPGTPNEPICRKMIRATDGSLLLVGNRPAVVGLEDMFVIRMNPATGAVLFDRQYSDNAYTMGGWIEETPWGTYLASGMAGSHIWAIELDTAGNEIQRQTMYQSPTNSVFDETSAVQQKPGGGFIVSGKPISFSPEFFYLGSYDLFNSSSQVWGGETHGRMFTPRVQADGSIFTYNELSPSLISHFTRLSRDSSVMWDTRIQTQISTTDFPLVEAIAYVGDTTAIGVGMMHVTGPGSHTDDLYFCRIRGIGLPFNAAEPDAVRPAIKGLPPLIAYPNPTEGELTVLTRSPLPVAVYSSSGRKVKEVAADGSGTTRVDLSGLPAGMYVIRQGEACVRVGRL